MMIIGIDPDSKAHGVSIYDDGKLLDLKNWLLCDLYVYLESVKKYSLDEIEVHIEDVCANNAVFIKQKKSYSGKDLAEVKARSRTLGKVQQSQIEIERVCEYFGIKVVKHKISKNWKDANGKKQFKMVTGWKKRSNEDTRSAAYMGFLGHKNGIKKIQ